MSDNFPECDILTVDKQGVMGRLWWGDNLCDKDQVSMGMGWMGWRGRAGVVGIC